MPNKIFYYDFTNDNRCSAAGVDLTRSRPPLAYQDFASWLIRVRDTSSGTPATVDLSAATAWRAAVSKGFARPSAPCCRTSAANVDASGAASGDIRVSLDSNTSSFFDALGSNESVTAFFELAGLDASGRQIYYFRFPIELVNTLDPSGGDPPEPLGDYYSKTEVASLVAGLQAQIAAKLASTITIDGVTYAIAATLDNGVPSLSLIPQ